MNDMKHTITSRLAALLLFAAGMAGCSEEDALPAGTTNPDSARSPMTVSVADGGYTTNAPSAPGTRAVEDGYTTRFTAGDRIGLYAVKNGTIVASNVCLTAKDNGSGGIAWTGDAYYEGTGAIYFAYYPYKNDLTGDLVPSASNAADFFANVVSRWTPATDQSTYAKYTAQDLMTGSGTLGSKQADGTYPLSFTLTHALALVVIETPVTKYTLIDKDSKPLPDYYIPALDTRFYGFTPYSPAVGTYRYLVKPAQSDAGDLRGSYTSTAADGSTATKEYAIPQNSITAANYVFYKVDGGAATTVTTKTHTLQAGDFYLSDGSLVRKDAKLSEAQKAACLGIVFYVGDIKDDNYGLLDGKFPGGTHGLVVSLWDMPDPGNGKLDGMEWTYGRNEYVNNWLGSQNGVTCTWTDRPDGFTSIQEQYKMQGYANTVALEEYNKYVEDQSHNKNQDLRVKPVKSLAAFQSAHPAPASSSGWYWPSIYELQQVCWGQGVTSQGTNGKKMLNGQIEKAGSGTVFGYGSYWSSTEDSDYKGNAWYVDFFPGGVYRGGVKGFELYLVRPLIAF